MNITIVYVYTVQCTCTLRPYLYKLIRKFSSCHLTPAIWFNYFNLIEVLHGKCQNDLGGSNKKGFFQWQWRWRWHILFLWIKFKIRAKYRISFIKLCQCHQQFIDNLQMRICAKLNLKNLQNLFIFCNLWHKSLDSIFILWSYIV